MSMKNALVAALITATVSIAGTAQADLLGSTVNISAENGFQSGAGICKSAAVTGQTVGGGSELVAADWTGDCVGYYSADISGTLITLSGIETGNYSFAHFRLDITSGATVTGASFVGYTPDFFRPSGDNNDTNFSPIVTFGASFVDIVWDTLDDTSQFFFNGPGNGGTAPFGTAIFSITTDGLVVPEPPTAALIGLALAGLAFSSRKRARKEMNGSPLERAA